MIQKYYSGAGRGEQNMSSECDSIHTTVTTPLGNETPGFSEPTEAQVETAFRHLKRCASCRSSLSIEDRAKFIRNAILERE